ncbi:MAG: nucleoside hydrolase [Bacteroidota bacterium]|nr:nucleoside hydrolase [Bacteroidota bacterium]
MKFLFICLFTAMHFLIYSQRSLHAVPVILDTDIGPDYDDVGAVAVLHALANKGEAIPLAILASNKNEFVAPTINVLNTFFGRPDLPIGAPKGKAANIGAWQKWPQMLLSKYPHTITSTAEVPDAINIYRKILSQQPDHSVTIVSIGFLTNLSNLLNSKPDQFSKLTGSELVKRKVTKLVSMAGGFPKGREYNLLIDSTASAHVFNNWPTPIIFSGFEIGKDIKTGLGLVHDTLVSGPVKDVFAFCIPKAKEDRAGRSSWDETTVLVAIRGANPYFSLKRGHIIIHGGNNEWKDDDKGSQYYLTKLMSDEEISAILEKYMKMQQ